ncbi:MAG: hypothetical protein JWP87_398 [Labilithrix sp.]|nr:hypothetical protein [Labilithrix sp.]
MRAGGPGAIDRAMKRLVAMAVVGVAFVVACGSSGRGFDDGTSPPGSAPGAGGDQDFGAAEAGTDARPPPIGTLTGKVVMPEGTIPLSDALVYLTKTMPEPIPRGVYCDKCVQLDSYAFTYSKPDGTFDLPAYDAGDQYLVVQKGQFRRVRPIKVSAGTQAVDGQLTRLPGKTDAALGDSTPHMLIWPGQWDHVEKSLAKIGLTDFEKFEPGLDFGAYAAKMKDLASYHVVFLPCSGTVNDPGSNGMACSVSVDPQLKAAVKDFVGQGGKLYVSDWSYEYVRQGWPGFVSWMGETSQIGSGCQPGGADSPAQFDDPSLRDWMTAIGEGSASLKSAWSTIEKVNPVASVDENGKTFTQTPKVWASVKQPSGTHPATVSFQDRCGRVLYSTYHAEGSDTANGQGSFLAQEKALMHILLEVGVCVGPKPVPPVR